MDFSTLLEERGVGVGQEIEEEVQEIGTMMMSGERACKRRKNRGVRMPA